jgi:DNA-binding NarL/FixJ family response regulator
MVTRVVLADAGPQVPESFRTVLSVAPGSFDELTPRELEVLRLITQGLRNREIAARLVISEKTVGNHVSNIVAKLQVHDRSQAKLRALHGGLGQRDG